MSQPLLDASHRDACFRMQRCERSSETMKLPERTDWMFSARVICSVYTFATIQVVLMCDPLKHTQEVSLRPALCIRENQDRILINLPPLCQGSNQCIWKRDRAFFSILREKISGLLFPNRHRFVDEIDIAIREICYLLLTTTRTQEKAKNQLFFLVAGTKERTQLFLVIGLGFTFHIAGLLMRRKQTGDLEVAQE